VVKNALMKFEREEVPVGYDVGADVGVGRICGFVAG
jgi:hypothetical protein